MPRLHRGASRETRETVLLPVMGRKVIAFLSQVHFNPDISKETYILEPQEGHGGAPEG
jgi:hypothetical protein